MVYIFMHIQVESYLNEIIHLAVRYLPVKTLSMPAENFVVC